MKSEFTEEELEMMKMCSEMSWLDCGMICPYSESKDREDKCTDFIMNHNIHTPGFVYRIEVLNEE